MANWSWWQTLWVILVAPIGIFIVAWNTDPVPGWLVSMLVLLVTVALIGWAVRGVGRGVFVDERNKVSLSRFQTVLWTVLVLGGYLVMVVQNVRDGKSLDAALVTFPPEVLWVLGISGTSLVGSPLIRSIQANREPASGFEAEDADTVMGIVSLNVTPSESSWADMFRGEEELTKNTVDLGKVQMFFFTLVAVGVYGVLLGKVLAASPPYSAFPDLTEGIVGLLAISHAAYLTNKSVARTPTV